MPHRRRRAATALVAAAALTLVAAPARGAAGARAEAAQLASAAAWSAVAVSQGAAPVSGAHAINWERVQGVSYSFVDVVNAGSVDLSGATYTLATVRNQLGNKPIPTVTLEACVGATWNSTTNTCPGTLTVLGSASTGATFTSSIPLATGARLSLRATSDGPPGGSFTTTVGVAVTRAQVRPPTMTQG